jgi:mannose-6-phosphate isomerase
LLIKLLDCAEWLSLQVHPSDEKAVALHGPGWFGKTEAWHILDAAPGARLIAGLTTNTSREDMETAIRNGTILDFARYLDVHTGDTIFMSTGTIHALGPGLLIYEVQQTSDLTYRVYDWGRPQTEKRRLHIAESIAVANPASLPVLHSLPPLSDGSSQTLVSCRYFTLKMLSARSASIYMDTKGETFHALTVIEGSAQVQAEAETVTLGQFQSALIPAATGAYQIHPDQNFRMLMASVEE